MKNYSNYSVAENRSTKNSLSTFGSLFIFRSSLAEYFGLIRLFGTTKKRVFRIEMHFESIEAIFVSVNWVTFTVGRLFGRQEAAREQELANKRGRCS